MIALSRRAERDLDGLIRHFESLGRPEAQQSLLAAIDDALSRIEADAPAGLPAPRPYPEVAQPGRAWMKSGRCWVAYSLTDPPEVIAVFHDTADIPARL